MAIDRDQLERIATEKVADGRTWAKRRTIAEWAGRKKVSSADLDEIQEVLEAAGIGLYPTPLRLCEPDDTVRISCGESPEVGLEFGSEAELREFLLTHHKRLHPLARLDSLKPEVRVPFDDSYVVVDLVGTESRGVVVIELKLGDGYYKIGSQIRRYIEAMELEEAKRASPRRVRGVVITGSENPYEEAEICGWAEDNGSRVDWYYSCLMLKLTEAQPSQTTGP